MVAKVNSIVLLLTYSLRLDTVKRMMAQGRGEELYQAHQRVYDLVASRQAKGLYSSIRGTYFIDEDTASAVGDAPLENEGTDQQ